ncbi:ABC transporter permease [Paenibacillus sp. CAU 1782]
MAENRSELDKLWRERKQRFRREIMPYIRYMGQSGFPAFMSLIIITAIISYAKLVIEVPANFPIAEIGVLVLTPFLSRSPLRTWLHPADVVYLMPSEHKMGSFLSLSFKHSIKWSGIAAAFVFFLFAPLYSASLEYSDTGGAGVWLLAFVCLVLRGANYWGAWQERRTAWSGYRLFYRILRWLLTALVIGSWLIAPLWQAAIFTLLCVLLMGVLYRNASKSFFPWERLIAEERATRKRFYAFFSLFIDVPVLDNSIARRPYLTWLLRRISYGQRNTYVYMYAASLLRTEIGGILLRIAGLGCLVTYWAGDYASLSGWSAVFSMLVFGFVYSVQLGALRNINKYTVWKSIYPLPENGRIGQYLKVDAAALAAGLVLLWLSAALPLLFQGIFVPPVAAAVLLLLFCWRRPKSLRKKLLSEEEED